MSKLIERNRRYYRINDEGVEVECSKNGWPLPSRDDVRRQTFFEAFLIGVGLFFVAAHILGPNGMGLF